MVVKLFKSKLFEVESCLLEIEKIKRKKEEKLRKLKERKRKIVKILLIKKAV